MIRMTPCRRIAARDNKGKETQVAPTTREDPTTTSPPSHPLVSSPPPNTEGPLLSPTPEDRGTQTQNPPSTNQGVHAPTASTLANPQVSNRTDSVPRPQTPWNRGPRGHYKKHAHHNNKSLNWSLSPFRPIIVMGDSNIDKIDRSFYDHDDRFQVDCYPGANLTDAINILKNKTPISDSTQKVILSFGINNKDQRNPTLLDQAFSNLLASARRKFPNATVYVPVINYSKGLTFGQQRILSGLNETIRTYPNHIPEIGDELFQVEKDGIHWEKNTASILFDHWVDHLN